MFYFKCNNPRQEIWVSEFQSWVSFINVDNETGIFQTTRADVAAALRRVDVSGVVEITADQFVELEQKKKADLTLPKAWREEFSPSGNRAQTDTQSRPAPPATAAPSSAPPPSAAAAAEPPPKLTQQTLPQASRPTARKKAPKPPEQS